MLGREAERARIRSLLERALDGDSAACVVRGERGSGKTSALRAAAEDAEALGLQVVRVMAVDEESDLTWAGLDALCRPFRRHLPGIAAHQRAALESALGLGPPVPTDRFLVAVAALQLLALAADEQPLLLVVDDADKLDRESAEVLGFLVRRLDQEGIVVLLADASGAFARLDEVVLGPLDEFATAEILEAESRQPATPAVAAAVRSQTNGNPLAVREVARGLRAAQLVGAEPLPNPLPIGQRTSAAHRPDLTDLDRGTGLLLLLVAVAGGASVEDVERAAAVLELDRTVLLDLQHRGALEVSDGGRLAFGHPLVGAAVHRDASPTDVRAAHAALASVLDPQREPVRRAHHLAACTLDPDARVSEQVAHGAEAARSRAAPARAAQLFEDAARLAVDDEARFAHWADAAECALAAGARDRAEDLARQASDSADRVVRARAARVRVGSASRGRTSGSARRGLEAEAAAIADVAPALAVQMFVESAMSAALGRAGARALASADQAVALADGLPQPLPAMAAVARGAALVVAGRPEEGRAELLHVERLLEAEDLGTVEAVLRGVGLVLVWAEAFDEAADLLQRLIETVRRRGFVGMLPGLLLSSGILAHSTWDWGTMLGHLEEALSLSRATGQAETEVAVLVNLALFEVCVGRPRALARIDEAQAAWSGRLPRAIEILAADARALHALVHDDPSAAVQHLAVAARAEPEGNPAPAPWEADLVEALIGAGDLVRAREVVVAFAVRARESGNRRSIARATALTGVVAEQRDEGEALVSQAVAWLSEPELPFARARVRLLWGERLVREGSTADAEPWLREARHTFEQLGARPWADRVARALGLPAADEVPPIALNPEERRVTEGLAAGRAVGDVAAELFRSPKSVERTLATAVEKLGAHSADDLRPSKGSDASTVVEVSLLGGFSVRHGKIDLTPPAGMSAKALKLIALAEGTLHVDELVEALWPDAEPGRGRNRLRNVLTRLRASSGDLVTRRNDVLVLTPSLEVDVTEFRHAARRALALGDDPAAMIHAEEALERYVGDLLPDSLYEPWTAAARERLRRDRLALLDLYARHLEREGDLEGAVASLEDAIDADPFDEERYVRLGNLLLRNGRRSAALAVFRRAMAALAELGVQPSPPLRDVEAAARAPRRTD